MTSPNPKGRPVGSTAQTILVKKMLENADGILDAIIAKAMDGDASSAALILSRIVPALKAQAQAVQFDFDPTAPVSEQVEMVIFAISTGSVAADVGRQIIEAIGTLANVRAIADLETRMAKFEGREA